MNPHPQACRIGLHALAVSLFAFFAWTSPARARQSIQPIPLLSAPTAVSSDGSVVVGYTSDDKTIHAARSGPGGVVILNELPPLLASFASAVSPDGSITVGADSQFVQVCGGPSPTDFFIACAWFSDAQNTPIGVLPGDNFAAAAAVSDNGVVCGVSSVHTSEHRFCIFHDRGFLYSEQHGLTEITPVAPLTNIRPAAISADGVTVTGSGEGPDSRAFIWTASGGMRLLPALPNDSRSVASDISHDGRHIAGQWSSAACLWTRESSPTLLGSLPGPDQTINSVARLISGDGSVIIGDATLWLTGFPPQTQVRTFIWDRVHGMRDLVVALEQEYHVPLEGVFLSTVADLSRTGRYIAVSGAIDGEQSALLIDLGRPAACIADYNLDGLVASDDFFAFLHAFFQSSADVNDDGATDSADFTDFLTSFFFNC